MNTTTVVEQIITTNLYMEGNHRYLSHLSVNSISAIIREENKFVSNTFHTDFRPSFVKHLIYTTLMHYR